MRTLLDVRVAGHRLVLVAWAGEIGTLFVWLGDGERALTLRKRAVDMRSGRA